ncbi:MAG: MauE/DoxX family redox-associated membrane protein [Verrucomicrobiota bacterium]
MKGLFLTVRLVLAATFLYAGIVKASASAQFAVTLAPFTPLPETLLAPLATLLPWLEITAALLILTNPTKKIGASVIVLLCLIFCALIGWALSQGIIVACSCFGHDETPSAFKMKLAIARDIGLTIAALAVFFENAFRPPERTQGTCQKTPGNA